jgi:hypothetical protein
MTQSGKRRLGIPYERQRDKGLQLARGLFHKDDTVAAVGQHFEAILDDPEDLSA